MSIGFDEKTIVEMTNITATNLATPQVFTIVADEGTRVTITAAWATRYGMPIIQGATLSLYRANGVVPATADKIIVKKSISGNVTGLRMMLTEIAGMKFEFGQTLHVLASNAGQFNLEIAGQIQSLNDV